MLLFQMIFHLVMHKLDLTKPCFQLYLSYNVKHQAFYLILESRVKYFGYNINVFCIIIKALYHINAPQIT